MSLIIILPWTTHYQHQNMCLCIGNESHHYPTMNYTLSTPKQSKPKVFQKPKLQYQLCIQTITLYKGRWYFSRSQTPRYILIKRKQVNKLPKDYPPHGSSNNQKETKSHGFPCDSTINHKETISHGSPCESTINHKETMSRGSPCESTINHKEIMSHGSPSMQVHN
jgi:hypothetical protein